MELVQQLAARQQKGWMSLKRCSNGKQHICFQGILNFIYLCSLVLVIFKGKACQNHQRLEKCSKQTQFNSCDAVANMFK